MSAKFTCGCFFFLVLLIGALIGGMCGAEQLDTDQCRAKVSAETTKRYEDAQKKLEELKKEIQNTYFGDSAEDTKKAKTECKN